jgi:hypothetical protein
MSSSSSAKVKALSEAKSVPDLSNATPTFLLDEVGRIRAEANRLKFLEGVYKDALRARITTQQLNGEEPILGDKYVGYYENISQVRIDSEAVREHFRNDPDTLEKLCKVIEYPQLNVKPKETQTQPTTTPTTPKTSVPQKARTGAGGTK